MLSVSITWGKKKKKILFKWYNAYLKQQQPLSQFWLALEYFFHSARLSTVFMFKLTTLMSFSIDSIHVR